MNDETIISGDEYWQKALEEFDNKWVLTNSRSDYNAMNDTLNWAKAMLDNSDDGLLPKSDMAERFRKIYRSRNRHYKQSYGEFLRNWDYEKLVAKPYVGMLLLYVRKHPHVEEHDIIDYAGAVLDKSCSKKISDTLQMMSEHLLLDCIFVPSGYSSSKFYTVHPAARKWFFGKI